MKVAILKQVSAVILPLIVATPAFAEVDFDRFFTDRKTRMQLNQAREQHSFISPRANAAVDNIEELVLPDVKFNGMIIRDDGSTEVWINSTGSNQEENLGDRVERNSRRTQDGGLRITLPSGKTVKLKPGQVYSMETERVREAYEKIHDPFPPDKQEGAETENLTQAADTPPERESEPVATFDESELVEDPDAKIKLLEERVQKLEHAQTEN
ncbi:MAG TPA: hypothetical protein VF268_16140 [Gammaproteobacteria bacterium]